MNKQKAHFVIAVNWKDRWFLPACVSSIRRYHPDADITLLKDTFRGPVPTSRLERHFGLISCPVQRAYGGGGWIKLLPAMMGGQSKGFRYPLMVLDADVILLGPIFDELTEIEGAVVIAPDLLHAGESFSRDYISRQYLSIEKLLALGTSYQDIESFPWFNSGHVFLRGPYIEPAFIHTWVDWDSTPIAKRDPKFYPLTDQSVLNHYLLLNKQISLGVLDFGEWAGDQPAYDVGRERSRYKKSKDPGSSLRWCYEDSVLEDAELETILYRE